MRKIDILFIIGSLNAGGAERSLTNLLKVIDTDIFAVELLVLNMEGILVECIPKEVAIVKIDNPFMLSVANSISMTFATKKFILLFKRIVYSLKRKLGLFTTNDHADVYKSNCINLPGKYDVAVSYIHGLPLFILCNSVNARIKIGRIAADYNSALMDHEIYQECFNHIDYIFAVSSQCQHKLCKMFPESKMKVVEFPSLVLVDEIRKRSEEYEIVDNSNACLKLLTVSRLHYEKGIDFLLDAARMLVESHVEFLWYVIGSCDTDYYRTTIAYIKKYNLEHYVHLLGEMRNPIPYMKYCTIYVHPSRNEGKSNSVNEALVMGMPIIATNFDTVTDQIINEENGIIVEMSGAAIFNAITSLMNSSSLYIKICEHNNSTIFDNCKYVLSILNEISQRTTIELTREI
jgi:glycosyltransferase involved in cell wall biosynthesis